MNHPWTTCHLAVGDSITHHGLYPFYFELFQLTRHPLKPTEVLNRGVSGDTLGGALKRFPWDIAPLRADTASVMFGMNDLERSLYEPGMAGTKVMAERARALDRFEGNLRTLVGRLKGVAQKIFLFTPTIFDGTAVLPSANCPDYDIALAEAASRVARLGAEQGLQVINIRAPLLEINRRGQALRPDFTVVGPDRVHLEAAGHLLITYLLLKERGQAGDVARVSLDAPGTQVRESFGCQIDEFQATTSGLAFRYHAAALPFPVEESARAALDWFPFGTTFNRELIRVTGLTAGLHRLEINGKPICTVTHEEWAAGVNISMYPATPQNLQSHRVLALCRERWELIWKLRDLVMVECQAAPEGWPQRPALEQVLPLLDARLKAAAGKDWEDFFRRTGKTYQSNRARETEWARRTEQLLDEMHEAVRPEPYRFFMRKLAV